MGGPGLARRSGCSIGMAGLADLGADVGLDVCAEPVEGGDVPGLELAGDCSARASSRLRCMRLERPLNVKLRKSVSSSPGPSSSTLDWRPTPGTAIGVDGIEIEPPRDIEPPRESACGLLTKYETSSEPSSEGTKGATPG